MKVVHLDSQIAVTTYHLFALSSVWKQSLSIEYKSYHVNPGQTPWVVDSIHLTLEVNANWVSINFTFKVHVKVSEKGILGFGMLFGVIFSQQDQVSQLKVFEGVSWDAIKKVTSLDIIFCVLTLTVL